MALSGLEIRVSTAKTSACDYLLQRFVCVGWRRDAIQSIKRICLLESRHPHPCPTRHIGGRRYRNWEHPRGKFCRRKQDRERLSFPNGTNLDCFRILPPHPSSITG